MSLSSKAQYFTLKNNIPSYFFNTLSFSGEYIIDDLTSANLGFGYHYPKGTIFGGKDVKAWRKNLNAWFLTPEFRFYPGRDPVKGFYLGPYFRYSHFGTKWDGKLQRDSVTLVDYTTHLSLNEYGLGIQFGYKFLLSDRFCLDLSFLGLRFSWFTFKGKFTGLINEDEIFKIIDIEGVDEEGIFGIGKMIFDFFGSDASFKMPFTFPMMRTAISIGYTF